MKTSMAQAKTNLVQFSSYISCMLGIIFIPIIAKDFGASYLEIGLIVAAYNLTIFISSYIFGRASDMHGRKIILTLGLLASAISFFLQIFANDVLSLMLLRGLVGFCIGIFPPALTAYVYEEKGGLGTFSAYGSLGWTFGSFLAGIIAVYSQIFILGSLLFFLAFFISLKMHESNFERTTVPLLPIRLLMENSAIYLPYLLRHMGAFAVWAIFPLYLSQLGADKFWIGAIYSVNTLTQFLVMRKLDGHRGNPLFREGMILSILTFTTFTLAQDHYQMIPTLILLGFSWSFMYVGSLLDLTERNIERATSVGILNSVIGFAGIPGPIIGGILAQMYGLKSTMYFAAALTITGLVINSLLQRKDISNAAQVYAQPSICRKV